MCGEPKLWPSSCATTSTSQMLLGFARSKLPYTCDTPYAQLALQRTSRYAMPPWTDLPEIMCATSRGCDAMFAFQ